MESISSKNVDCQKNNESAEQKKFTRLQWIEDAVYTIQTAQPIETVETVNPRDFMVCRFVSITKRKQAQLVTLAKFADTITQRNGCFSQPTIDIADVRKLDDDARKQIKTQNLYAFCLQSCNDRKTKKNEFTAQDCNPLVCLDFDCTPDGKHLDNAHAQAIRDICASYPACILSAISFSGCGCFAVIRVYDSFWAEMIAKTDAERKQRMTALFHLMETDLGIPAVCDDACKDITRLRAASYDPDTFFNPECAYCIKKDAIDKVEQKLVKEAEWARNQTKQTSLTVKNPVGRPSNDAPKTNNQYIAWTLKVNDYARINKSCDTRSRHMASFTLAKEAGALSFEGGLSEAALKQMIIDAAKQNGIYDEESSAIEQQIDNGFAEGMSAARMRAEARELERQNAEQTLQDDLNRKHIATFKTADFYTLDDEPLVRMMMSEKLARSILPTDDGRWIDLEDKRLFTSIDGASILNGGLSLLKGKKTSRITWRSLGHVWGRHTATLEREIDYTRPSKSLQERGIKDGHRLFVINEAEDLPDYTVQYDDDAKQKALYIMAWIATRFENLEEARWFISYIAQALCEPQRKPSKAIDLLDYIGGTGKSVLASGLTEFLFGDAVKQIGKTTMPGSDFNGDTWKGLFNVHDEAPLYTREQHYKWKEMITSGSVEIRQKCKDVETINSQIRYIRTSNCEQITHDGTATDRRVAVFKLARKCDKTSLTGIVEYIGVGMYKSPKSCKVADYDRVRCALADYLREWYKSDQYIDVVREDAPDTTLKSRSRDAEFTRDKYALQVGQAIFDKCAREAQRIHNIGNEQQRNEQRFSLRLSLKAIREELQTAHIDLTNVQIKQAMLRHPEAFAHNSAGMWYLTKSAIAQYRSDIVEDQTTEAPVLDWIPEGWKQTTETAEQTTRLLETEKKAAKQKAEKLEAPVDSEDFIEEGETFNQYVIQTDPRVISSMLNDDDF